MSPSPLLFIAFAALAEPAAPSWDEAARVLVVAGRQHERLYRRLEAELATLSLTAVRRTAGAPSTPEATLRLARAAHAFAAIVVLSRRGALDLSVVDRVTGKVVSRRLPPDPTAVGDLGALRAVELLRATLLEVGAPWLPPGEVTVTPRLRELASLSPAPIAAAAPGTSVPESPIADEPAPRAQPEAPPAQASALPPPAVPVHVPAALVTATPDPSLISEVDVVAAVNPAPIGTVPSVEVGRAPASAPPRGLRRAELAIGTGMLWAPGGLDPSWQLWLGGAWQSDGIFGSHLVVGLPLSNPAVEASEGRGTLRVAAAMLAPHARWVLQDVSLRVGFGLAILVVETRGEAVAPFEGRTQTGATFAPSLDFATGWRFRPWGSVGVGAAAGYAISAIHLRFAGREVASWGPLWLGWLVTVAFHV